MALLSFLDPVLKWQKRIGFDIIYVRGYNIEVL